MIKPRMKNGKIIFLLQILLLLLMTTAVMSCKKKPIDPIEEEPTFVRLKPDLQLQSIRLNRSINYAVLLPDNYTDESLRFPVVYLLLWRQRKGLVPRGEYFFLRRPLCRQHWISHFCDATGLQQLLARQIQWQLPLYANAYQ